MYNDSDIELIKALCALPHETPWLEFKSNNFDPDMIGADICALANSAVLNERDCSYMIWGVDDATHEIVGTSGDFQTIKKGNEELENWLTRMLSANTTFTSRTVNVDGLDVFIVEISCPQVQPSTFKKEAYIRVGSITRKLKDLPQKEVLLWDRLRSSNFELKVAKQDLTLNEVFGLIDYTAYYSLKKLPLPSDDEGIAHYLLEDNILVHQDNDRYSITNLGAIALARRLTDFTNLSRKAIRLVQYEGKSRINMLKQMTIDKGYAVGMTDALNFIYTMTPNREEINGAFRETKYAYPPTAIRETLANALIHQDFSATGTSVTVEIFDSRIEITNPGAPLVDIDRIIDNPPRSRNEKLARLMRHFNLCEELGTGWDKIVLATEKMQLPAPTMIRYEENTRVVLFSSRPFNMLTKEDKLHATYQHACVKYLQGDAMTNKSLRERFGLPDSASASISRLIKEAIKEERIKPYESQTSNKYLKYLPFWV